MILFSVETKKAYANKLVWRFLATEHNKALLKTLEGIAYDSVEPSVGVFRAKSLK